MTLALAILLVGCSGSPKTDDTAPETGTQPREDFAAIGAPPQLSREDCAWAIGSRGVDFEAFEEEGVSAGVRIENLGSEIELHDLAADTGDDGALRTACPTAISLIGAAQGARACGLALTSVGHFGSIDPFEVDGSPSAHTWGAAVDIGSIVVDGVSHYVTPDGDDVAMAEFSAALQQTFGRVVGPDDSARLEDFLHAETTESWTVESATTVECP